MKLTDVTGVIFVVCHHAFLTGLARERLVEGIWEWREAGYPNGIFFTNAYFWVPAFTPGHEP